MTATSFTIKGGRPRPVCTTDEDASATAIEEDPDGGGCGRSQFASSICTAGGFAIRA
jgi:hypothetical protein